MKPEKLPGIAGLKDAMRRQMRLLLRAMPETERAEASAKICRKAAELPAFQEGRMLALFAPLPGEPDIRPLIEEAWARDKSVVFPLMARRGESPQLDWHLVTGWDELTSAGPFGVLEPDPTLAMRAPPEEIDCLFVPGLAFDQPGGRLGRGGGYYDAALACLDVGAPRVGLMFARQRVGEVPRAAHDQLLSFVVTEEGVVTPN